jgi:hypothetical protein
VKWTIEQFDAPQKFRVKLRGAFNSEETREIKNEVSAEMAKSSGGPILFDNSDLNIQKVDRPDLEASINAFVRHNPRFAHIKIAIYSGALMDLELAYCFKAVTESLSSAITEVFRRESDPIRWLTFCRRRATPMSRHRSKETRVSRKILDLRSRRARVRAGYLHV